MGQYEKLLLALMSGAKDRKVPSPVHAPGLYRRDPVQYAARRPTRRHDQPADHPKQTCRRHRKGRYPLLRAPRAASHERPIMLSLNTPDKYAMERGGWSSDKTMKQTYQHTMSETRKKIDANIDAYFDSIMNPKKRLRWRIKKTNITMLQSKCQKTP